MHDTVLAHIFRDALVFSCTSATDLLLPQVSVSLPRLKGDGACMCEGVAPQM